MKEESIYFQALLLGDSTVGKTSFLIRYTDEDFKDTLFTIGIDSKIQNLKKNNRNITLKIYDTAGQERYRSIVQNYYKGADGIILMYDITNKNSFESIEQWINNIKESSNYENIGLVVVGNKCDLENNRVVKKEEKELLEKEIEMKIIEASAKLDINVKESFNLLIDKMIEKKSNKFSLSNTIKIKNEDKKTGDCCIKKKK